MTLRIAHVSVAAATVISGLALSACGLGGLSASSSCRDFMNASAIDQHEVTDQLAGHFGKPDFATPLGEPEVPYYCAANPSVTLGQFFQKAEG
jgi:hypothetical protein